MSPRLLLTALQRTADGVCLRVAQAHDVRTLREQGGRVTCRRAICLLRVAEVGGRRHGDVDARELDALFSGILWLVLGNTYVLHLTLSRMLGY